MNEKWIVTNKKSEFEKLRDSIKLNPLITRLLANRGIKTKKEAELFLNGTIENLYDGNEMKDMKKGVQILRDAIINKKKIIIYGDYDCDGVCSTAILYKTLKELKANFNYYIPNRESEGYGMNSDRVETLYNEGYEILLTCDNGISAIDEVKRAKEFGMTVIITDHHDIPFKETENGIEYFMPEADCIINPKRMDCLYPFKELCGAGITLKLSIALSKEMNISLKCFEDIVQFASIATVCDVVSLSSENRIIVKEGLKLINKTNNLGLKELIKVTNSHEKTIAEYHYGFVFGPCINATGRLEIADYSVELLITEDFKEAEELAKKLYNLNLERKEATEESLERVLEKLKVELKQDERVILVYDENIHESIAGIVAGRIREYYNLPSLVITKGKELPKGSGRSIEGYNMFEELSKCREYIEKFGGHPMAVGLSVKKQNLLPLKEALISKCKLSEEDVMPLIRIDCPLNIENVDENLLESLEELRPFGTGNPSPVLAAKSLKVKRVFFMGKNKNFLKFRFERRDNQGYIEGINFNKYEDFRTQYISIYGNESFLKLEHDGYGDFLMSVIYYPGINEYNGKRTIQLNIKNIRLEK